MMFYKVRMMFRNMRFHITLFCKRHPTPRTWPWLQLQVDPFMMPIEQPSLSKLQHAMLTFERFQFEVHAVYVSFQRDKCHTADLCSKGFVAVRTDRH